MMLAYKTRFLNAARALIKMLLGSARRERSGCLLFRNTSTVKSCWPDTERVRDPSRFHT